ncbi:hypothetical protein J4414_00735 [Candidatus Woesearchaeota archaeon]|nr:hypothetical protein [Candidatus Woesearchaeota archaeon]
MFLPKDKKGVEVVFVWIFVVIAGAVIIAFFVSFAFRHAETSTAVTDIRYLDTISSIITTFATSLEADKTINLPTKVEVLFHCDGILMESGGREYNRQIPNHIIFGTERLADDKILLWTVPWRLPYTITNLIYTSSPHVKYFLIYDSASRNFVNELASEIPSRFLTEPMDVRSLNIENIDKDSELRQYYKNKFVFFTTPQKVDEIKNMKTDSSIVQIGKDNYGDITFYEETEKTSKYIGNELIYGAIFTDDYDTYTCLLEKTMNKHSQITSLYAEKARLLLIKSVAQCSYSQIKSTLDREKTLAQTLNIPELYKNSQLLIEENRLLDNQDCSLIF